MDFTSVYSGDVIETAQRSVAINSVLKRITSYMQKEWQKVQVWRNQTILYVFWQLYTANGQTDELFTLNVESWLFFNSSHVYIVLQVGYWILYKLFIIHTKKPNLSRKLCPLPDFLLSRYITRLFVFFTLALFVIPST